MVLMDDDDDLTEYTYVTCECCGREFRIPPWTDGRDQDGVVFCPDCKPEY